MKVFGKEPAFWVGCIQALLMLLLSFDKVGHQWLHLTDVRVAAIAAVLSLISAAYTAYVLKNGTLATLTELAKGVIALLVAYNVNLTADQMTLIMGFISIIGSGWLRKNNSPLVTPQYNAPADAPVLTQASTTLAA